MRQLLLQFMLYSRSERRAIIGLSVLIILVLIIPGSYHFYMLKKRVDYHDRSVPRDILSMRGELSDSDSEAIAGSLDSVNIPAVELFYFDPNTIGLSEWQRLGLSVNQANVIEKYKAKGGRFRKPDDLRKIYVLSDDVKAELIPYVRISQPDADKFYSIEINSADSAAFEELDGIGPYLSSKIVSYRRALGGFYAIDQLKEIHGISDTTFALIKPHLRVNAAKITKININSAEYETLQKHKYIHAKIAHAIISYRNMNGKFESIEELKNIRAISEIEYTRILPYLTIN